MSGYLEEVFKGAPPSWLTYFFGEPEAALDALLTGSYYHGSLNPVDPEHLLLDWASAIGKSAIGKQDFNTRLADELSKWIDRRWGADDREVPCADEMWQRALRVTALLDPPPYDAIKTLRRQFDTSTARLGPMTRNPAHDPLGWYWATISRVQEDDALVSQWLRLCNLVPGTPVFHGHWGLLGLRRSPGADDREFRESVMLGLERYLTALDRKVEERSLRQRDATRFALGEIRDLLRTYLSQPRWRQYWSTRGNLSTRVREWLTSAFGGSLFQRP